MTWHAYRLVYRLKSPLHVGWRKIGNLMQTRPYIPGRSWWGAATALLTQHLGEYNYPAVGKLVRDNLIFSYFFLATDPDIPLLPRWDENQGKMCYGNIDGDKIDGDKFEQQFLKSQAATAIDAQSNTSLEGQLYEVEYIAPHIQETSNGEAKPVFAIGYLFARAGERINCQSDDVVVDGKPLFNQVLQRVQIGGERRYGFGTLELQCKQGESHNLFNIYSMSLDGEYPILTIPKNKPVPAHLRADSTLVVQGELEPLVGREWCQKNGPGNCISEAQICWSPGMLVKHESVVELQPLGVCTTYHSTGTML